MHWTAPGRALIAWDSGQGPHFARGPGGAYLKRKAFESFDVYRTADPAELTGILIGTTRAEAFFDTDAPEGLMVWYRVVGRTKDGGTIPVGARVPVIIPTRSFASADTMPPSPPDNFKVRPRSTGKLLTWHAACDAESGLLAYMVYDADQDQPDSVVWANDTVQAKSHAVRRFLDRTTNKKKRYRLRAIDCALNLSEGGPVAGKSADGWTVYTFSASSQFTIAAKETLDADTLIVAGGGSAGAGTLCGGGGGAGGVIDVHGVPIVAGENDGNVVVGTGGDEVPWEIGLSAGHNGGDSSFAGLSAIGGGYGGGNDGAFNYAAADGASGGGGDPFSAGPVPEEDHYHGHGGKATAGDWESKSDVPYADGDVAAYWTSARENGYAGGIPTDHWTDADGQEFWTVTRQQGHDGGDGEGHTAWYNITCGGGGGAHDLWLNDSEGNPIVGTTYFTYDQGGYQESAGPRHGGHGVPCDIAGWPMWEETAKTFFFVPWFGGGGAGKEEKTWWSYSDGRAGYGGGGAVNHPGVDGTGGGGGGCGVFGVPTPGPAGGDGVVIIRIPTADEDLVTYPLITGTDPDPEHNEFGLPVCLCDDPHVTIRRLPEYMTHNDESGDEPCPRTYEETHA